MPGYTPARLQSAEVAGLAAVELKVGWKRIVENDLAAWHVVARLRGNSAGAIAFRGHAWAQL